METTRNKRKYVIVGGVAGGATAAARIRRLTEDAEIILFEKGEYISPNEIIAILLNHLLSKGYTGSVVKTVGSSLLIDNVAKKLGIPVIETAVGFKHVGEAMRKNDVIIGGEESGGMIMGSEDLIESMSGRKAIAMREKSATEAIIVAASLAAKLEEDNKTLSEYLIEIFDENNIIAKFDVREDISYYNESEPDIEKLKQAKVEGEKQRTKNDLFYLSLAIAIREGKADVKSTSKDPFVLGCWMFLSSNLGKSVVRFDTRQVLPRLHCPCFAIYSEKDVSWDFLSHQEFLQKQLNRTPVLYETLGPMQYSGKLLHPKNLNILFKRIMNLLKMSSDD